MSLLNKQGYFSRRPHHRECLRPSVQQRAMSSQHSATVTQSGVANTPIATQLTFVG